MSRILAETQDARRKYVETQRQADGSARGLKRSPSTRNLLGKDHEAEETDALLKANLGGVDVQDVDEEEAEGFLIVQLPDGFEAPVADSPKAAAKIISHSTGSEHEKGGRGLWPWSGRPAKGEKQ